MRHARPRLITLAASPAGRQRVFALLIALIFSLLAACVGGESATDSAADDASSGGADASTVDAGGGSDAGAIAADAAADTSGGAADGGASADVTGSDASEIDAQITDAASPDAVSSDAVSSSDAGAGDASGADAGPQDVFALKPGQPVKAIISQVSVGPWVFAAPVEGDVSLVVDKAGAVKLAGPLEGQLDPVAGTVKAATAVVRFGGMTYLADATGLQGILNGKLKLSPLAQFLPKQPITAMWVQKTVAGTDLWLVVGSKLMLYRGSKLYTITAPGMDATGAHLSYGADVEGAAALWVGGPAGLHALRVSGGKVTAWPYLKGRPVVGVHVDAKGRVWAASKGELLRRDAPGKWTTHVPEEVPTGLWGRPGDAEFWLTTSKSVLRWDAGELHVVEGAPQVAAWQLDANGRLSGLTAKGALLRVQTTAPPAKPKVAWKTDIEPLFQKSCALCHGISGVNTKLHTRALWQAKFDLILKNVSGGAMPLPPKQPLTPGEIALIKAWKKDGFKETP